MSSFLNFNGNQGMTFKTFTASGTSYTLDKSASTNSVLVSVGGVMQQPGVDYTVSGTTLTSTSAWTAGVQVDTYIIHKPGTAPTIQDNSIDSDHYVDGSIDLAHMSSQSVDEDNLHISNAGSNGQFLSKQSGDAGGLTWAAAGGGKVLQVASLVDTSSATLSSTSEVDSGLGTLSMTPASTSNNIIIWGQLVIGMTNATTSSDWRLFRQQGGGGYSAIANSSFLHTTVAGTHIYTTVAFLYYDSPSSTAQNDYQIHYSVSSSDSLAVPYQGWSGLFAMEIDGT